MLISFIKLPFTSFKIDPNFRIHLFRFSALETSKYLCEKLTARGLKPHHTDLQYSRYFEKEIRPEKC